MPSQAEERISSRGLGVDLRVAVDVAPGVEARRVPRLQRQAQVLVDRQAAEQVGDLERAREALLADAVRRAGRGSSRPCRRTRAAVGREQARTTRLNRVVLPAPFGPISAWISPALDREARVRDGADAAEVLGDAVDLEHRSLRARRAQERRQRQALVDLAPAHRGGFLGRRPPAPLQLRPDADEAARREQHEADEDEAEPEQPVAPSRSRTARGTGCRTATPSAGPRMWCMPPITTIASSSPENGDRDAPPPRRGRSGSRAARRRARSPPPRARTPRACSARPR